MIKHLIVFDTGDVTLCCHRMHSGNPWALQCFDRMLTALASSNVNTLSKYSIWREFVYYHNFLNFYTCCSSSKMTFTTLRSANSNVQCLLLWMLTGYGNARAHRPLDIFVFHNNWIKQKKSNVTSSCRYAMAISVGFPAVFTSAPTAAAPSAIAVNLRWRPKLKLQRSPKTKTRPCVYEPHSPLVWLYSVYYE